MLIGKGINQPKDCYRFLNLETLEVIASRDVLGLGKTYGEWKGLKKNIRNVDREESDEEWLIKERELHEEENEEEEIDKEESFDMIGPEEQQVAIKIESESESEDEVENNNIEEKPTEPETRIMSPRVTRSMSQAVTPNRMERELKVLNTFYNEEK